ncbi:hypothetical protein [Methanobrevibacter sp.]|nr:hypothetical protein [Methanobrevibacter sp.]MDO5824094.1 hypothetical protein [Methanobrevibacter sp.]
MVEKQALPLSKFLTDLKNYSAAKQADIRQHIRIEVRCTYSFCKSQFG